MKKFLIIAIPLVLLIAVSIGAYRAWLQLKTMPNHSVSAIREAVAKRDLNTFNKLVDIDAVLEDAAEEILTAQINDNLNSMTYSSQDIHNLYETLKADFMVSTKDAVVAYITNGRVVFPDTLTKTQKWLKDSEINSCVIRNASKNSIVDGVAHAKVMFYNVALKFNFEIEIILEKIDTSTWRIIEARGFEGYLNGVNRAFKQKLESINAPIRDKIDNTFKIEGFDAKVGEGDDYGFSKTLQLEIKANLQSDKPLSKIIGNIIIDGRDNQVGITPFEIDVARHPLGMQIFNVDKVLNPFVKADADVMRHGLRKRAIHIDVTEIEYLDGTHLKQLDQLPD